MASSTATQSSLHHDGQFVIRLPPTQRVNPEASTWLAAEEPAMRKKPAKRGDVPRHPIPSMQEAFAESLDEIGAGTLALKPKLRTADAPARWEALLDQDKSQGPPAALWRYRPGQSCHELRKLMAQISFGVYLLLNGMANSNAQVVSILQGHIDEVDEFLEMAMEDLKVAAEDLTKRLDLLRLPMDNVVVFERMLEERPFRLQIVEGNIKIEHILSRAQASLTQYACDVTEGLVCTDEFSAYLTREQRGAWRKDRPDVIDIFEAMRGNTDGWLNAFADLQKQNKTLNALVVQLNATVAEMDKKAGEVSRRTRFSIQPYSSPISSHDSGSGSPLPSHVESPTASPLPSPPPSPGAKISQSPPRLSLRFSSLHDNRISRASFFDLSNQGSLFTTHDAVPAAAPAATPSPAQPAAGEVKNSANEASGDGREPVDETKEAPPSEKTVEVEIREPSVSSSDADSEDAVEQEVEVPISTAEEAKLDSPTTNALYILQPRTYTPLPPAPLPSPRLIKDTGSEKEAAATSAPRTGDVAEFPMPPQKSRLRQAPSPTTETAPKAVRRVSSTVKEERQSSRMSSPRRIDEEPTDPENGSPQGQQRTSLRQRVSLRTTPPQSIQVPPPNAVELQRPVFASPKTFKNYKTFTGPDSAYGSDVDRSAVNSAAYGSDADRTAVHSSTYGSDIDRTAVNSMAESLGGSGADFSPPAIPGNMVPSPQSDQQYFRPVQASPHSPLQQRPHTAGHAASTRQLHQRNAPSAMGMSMLSSVTTMDSDTSSKRPGLKKKRSAFGWLKKAFTLDEEERAAFDQRKREQTRNLYFDARSPQFLDGRRIR